MQMQLSNNRENGNILFLILIAVGLFAALSYVIGNSSRSGAGSTEAENTRLQVTRIIQYANYMRASILRLSAGANISEISFDSPLWGDNRYEHGVPRPDRNKVFNRDGGDIPFQRPEAGWLDKQFASEDLYGNWFFTGAACVPEIGSGASGCDARTSYADLIMVLPFIPRHLCQALNYELDLRGPSGDPPVLDGSPWTGTPYFTGTYGGGGEIIDAENTLRAIDAACFESSGGGLPANSYHFYMTLIHR